MRNFRTIMSVVGLTLFIAFAGPGGCRRCQTAVDCQAGEGCGTAEDGNNYCYPLKMSRQEQVDAQRNGDAAVGPPGRDRNPPMVKVNLIGVDVNIRHP